MDTVTRSRYDAPILRPHARSNRKLWAEEIAEAMERRNQGDTLESISERMGCESGSLQRAIKRAERYGFMTHPPRLTGE